VSHSILHKQYPQVYLFIMLVLLGLNGCGDSNPAKPPGKIGLQVTVTSYQDEPISNATVLFLESMIIDSTDDNGMVIYDILPGMIHFQVGKIGYETIQDSIEVSAQSYEKIVHLDGYPVIDSLRVVSGLDERNPIRERRVFNYLLEVQVLVTDPDGIQDIANVSFLDPLTHDQITLTPDRGNWYRGALDFGTDGLADLTARFDQPIIVTVTDQHGLNASHTNSLSYFFQYNDLFSELFQIISIPETDPSFDFYIANVYYTPIRYRISLILGNDANTVPLDTLVVFENVQAGEWVTVFSTCTLQLYAKYWWVVNLLDPSGSWVRTRREVVVFN